MIIDTDKPGLGRAVLDGIIKDGLVTAHMKGLCVWDVRTDEVIEAIIEDWHKNAKRCDSCENYALNGEEEDNGPFTCSSCLPPLEE